MTTVANWVNYDTPYALPDQTPVKINTCRFRVAEPLFQPLLIGVDSDGVHDMLIESILDVDTDVRGKVWENIILSGGSTMLGETTSNMPGNGIEFPKRLIAEIKASEKLDANFRSSTFQDTWVKDVANRDNLVFLGGAIVASLSDFAALFADPDPVHPTLGGPTSNGYDGAEALKFYNQLTTPPPR